MKAVIWSKDNCAYCDQAKALMAQHSIEFEERKVGQGFTREDLLAAVPTARTVPQIFLNEELIGGFEQLKTRLKNVN